MRQRLLRGGVWVIVARVAAAPVFLGANALLTRLLEPGAVGTYFLLASIAGIVATIGQFGTGRASIRLIAADLALANGRGVRRIAARVLSIALASSLITAVLYHVLATTVLVDVFRNESLRATSAVTAGWLVGIALNRTLADVFLGLHDVRLSSTLGQSTEGFLPGLVLLAGLGTLWVADSGSLQRVVTVSMIAMLGSALMGAGLLTYRLGRLRMATAGARDDEIGYAAIVRMSVPMMVTALTAFTISYKFEVWLLAAVRPAADVALYGAAIRLVVFIAMPLMMANAVLPPIIAELHATGQRDRLERLLRGTALLAGLPAALVLAGFVLGGGTILEVIYGPYYAAAAPALVIISVGQLAAVWAGSCGVTLMMTGHEVVRMKLTVATSIAGLLLGLLGAWRFGVVGLAVVSAAKAMFQNAMLVTLARRRVGVWTHVDFSRAALTAAWNGVVRR